MQHDSRGYSCQTSQNTVPVSKNELLEHTIMWPAGKPQLLAVFLLHILVQLFLTLTTRLVNMSLHTCFNTSLQHVFSTLLYKKAFNTSFQHLFSTRFYNISSLTFFSTRLCNTSFQYFPSTRLYNICLQDFLATRPRFTTLLYNMFFKTFLQHVFATLLHNTSIPCVLVTVHIFPTLFATRLFNMSFLQHFFTTLLYPPLFTTSLQPVFSTHLSTRLSKTFTTLL